MGEQGGRALGRDQAGRSHPAGGHRRHVGVGRVDQRLHGGLDVGAARVAWRVAGRGPSPGPALGARTRPISICATAASAPRSPISRRRCTASRKTTSKAKTSANTAAPDDSPRGGVATLAVLLVVALIATGVAVNKSNQANRERNQADSARVLAEASAAEALTRGLAAEDASLLQAGRGDEALLVAVEAQETAERARIGGPAAQEAHDASVAGDHRRPEAGRVLRRPAGHPDRRQVLARRCPHRVGEPRRREYACGTREPVGSCRTRHRSREARHCCRTSH